MAAKGRVSLIDKITMKKKILNFAVALVFVAGLVGSVLVPWWAVWFICLPVMYWAAVWLLRHNTNWIRSY